MSTIAYLVIKSTSFFCPCSSNLLHMFCTLQFSKVTGRLQLVDATGAIDVVIPDLETSECFQQVCQVITYLCRLMILTSQDCYVLCGELS